EAVSRSANGSSCIRSVRVAIRKFVLPRDNRHCERSEPRRTPGQRAWFEPRRTPGLDCFGALRAPRNDNSFPDVVNFRTRTLGGAGAAEGAAASTSVVRRASSAVGYLT